LHVATCAVGFAIDLCEHGETHQTICLLDGLYSQFRCLQGD
jgi:hypothetical protein